MVTLLENKPLPTHAIDLQVDRQVGILGRVINFCDFNSDFDFANQHEAKSLTALFTSITIWLSPIAVMRYVAIA